MKKLLLLSALLIFACSSDDSSNTNDNNNNNELLNCDGNPVPTIVYGGQEWTVENACHTTYRDGTPIPQVTDYSAWGNLTTGAWCYYENDPTKGVLYNWYAVMGIWNSASLSDFTIRKEFAPEGWHIPSDEEWTTLKNYLIANGYNYDGTTSENKIAKSMASTTGWNSATITGAIGNDQSLNNSSGFNAKPEGYREFNGPFYFGGDVTTFLSSTEGNEDNSNSTWGYTLNSGFKDLLRGGRWQREGSSARLVKD